MDTSDDNPPGPGAEGRARVVAAPWAPWYVLPEDE